MKACINHPDKKALSICHNCHQDFCEECLTEGSEFYYCKKPECQVFYNLEKINKLPGTITCPNCSSVLELSEEEKVSGMIHCGACESLIDFKVTPPKIINRDEFVELLASFNQGDIALIKSILEDANIAYYVFGENFLSIDPLIQPARFYVDEKQIDEANELLKNFELRIWGTSKSEYEENETN